MRKISFNSKDIGELRPGELEERDVIRHKPVPKSDGPDPDIYTEEFVSGRLLKFKKGIFDPWNSWFEFQSEVDVREKFWYSNIKEGDVVIDIGASWGSYAIAAGVLGARVYAYEPDYRIYPEFLTNIKLNSLSETVKAFNYGLSDNDDNIDWEELKNIQLHKLDNVYTDSLDYIKIDVEGQELKVLEGSIETLKRFKPKLLIEAHISYNENMLSDILNFIPKNIGKYQMVIAGTTWDTVTMFLTPT